MNVLNKISLIVLMFFYCSCDGRYSSNPDSTCIEINNKGSESVSKYQQGEKDQLAQAVMFFKDAIKCNPQYLLAYLNLALAYDYQRDYKKELDVYNKVLSLSPNDPNMQTEKGVVFEKLKQLDSARVLYQFARQGFNDRLKTQPNDVNSIRGLLLLLALTEGKESALLELKKRTTLNPKLSSEMASEYYFYQDFDKSAYIYHLTQ